MPDCDHFKDFEIKDGNDANFSALMNNHEVDGGRIQIRGKVNSGWRVSGEIEQLDLTTNMPNRAPALISDPYSATPPNFRIEWLDYNPEEPEGADKYSYKIIMYADNMTTFETCEKSIPIKFRRRADQPPPPPPPGNSTSVPKAKLAALLPANPEPSSGCVPKALPGYCVRFPHKDAVAIYNPCDGLLVFGETPHCVFFGARMFSKDPRDPKTYHAKPVNMGPGWWILQFKRDKPEDAPLGNVHLVVTDNLGSGPDKHRHIEFCILDVGCTPGQLITEKRRFGLRR